jgi:glyoxylase-like metal-dependent hydrolase (beta-lactamase superfamily II)
MKTGLKAIEIHPFRVGVTNCFFIGAGGAWALVDSSGPRALKPILKQMKRLGIAQGELRLVILTHGHFDHVGSASAVRDATAARILIHRLDRAMIDGWAGAPPKGFTRWGRLLEALVPLIERLAAPVPVRADIVMEGERLSLVEFGIAAEVLHTPGHTPGSISVLLPGGTVLVGDLAFNGSIFCRRPRHVLGMDLGLTRASWKRLLERGMKTAFPGHGRRFAAARLDGN